MWNIIKSLLPKPPTPDEQLWRFVIRGLESDAKLLASGLDVAGRSSAGIWATMQIECEIAALRAWICCSVLSGGRQADGEALIKAFESRFIDWVQQKRNQFLNSYCVFTQSSLEQVLSSLSQGWRHYEVIAQSVDSIPSEKFVDLVALFWGRCVEGYTNKKIEAFLSLGEAQIDQFMPRYVSLQLQLAKSLAEQAAPRNR